MYILPIVCARKPFFSTVCECSTICWYCNHFCDPFTIIYQRCISISFLFMWHLIQHHLHHFSCAVTAQLETRQNEQTITFIPFFFLGCCCAPPLSLVIRNGFFYNFQLIVVVAAAVGFFCVCVCVVVDYIFAVHQFNRSITTPQTKIKLLESDLFAKLFAHLPCHTTINVEQILSNECESRYVQHCHRIKFNNFFFLSFPHIIMGLYQENVRSCQIYSRQIHVPWSHNINLKMRSCANYSQVFFSSLVVLYPNCVCEKKKRKKILIARRTIPCSSLSLSISFFFFFRCSLVTLHHNHFLLAVWPVSKTFKFSVRKQCFGIIFSTLAFYPGRWLSAVMAPTKEALSTTLLIVFNISFVLFSLVERSPEYLFLIFANGEKVFHCSICPGQGTQRINLSKK